MEEWRRYRDTNYEISNLGRVRNKNTGHILKPYQKDCGKKDNDYLKISMYINKKKKQMPVHRLVAECFIEDYSEKLEVNHKNTKKGDNSLSNLEMTTREGNYQHSIRCGVGSQRKPVIAVKGEEAIFFKSLWEAAKFIKKSQEKDIKIDHICTNIKKVIQGKSKSCYGYGWELDSKSS